MNVAAVNYYFSSKEQLFEAVMDRRVPPLLAAREAGLARALEAGGEVEAILRAIFEPSVRIGFSHPHFARLASRLRYEEDSSRWQNYRTRQGDLPDRFQSALAAALPNLDREEVLRRFHLVMGAVGQLWSNMPPKCGETPESMIDRYVKFFSAGMRAGAL
jgi:AcrR family transcriptional regulator